MGREGGREGKSRVVVERGNGGGGKGRAGGEIRGGRVGGGRVGWFHETEKAIRKTEHLRA